MIITYQDNQLFIASSRVNHDGEAILFRVLEKVYEIEKRAMERLEKRLKPAQYQQFLRRIAEIKSRSMHFKDYADMKVKKNTVALQYYCRNSENTESTESIENAEIQWYQSPMSPSSNASAYSSSTPSSNHKSPHNTGPENTTLAVKRGEESSLGQSLLAKAQGLMRSMMQGGKDEYLSLGENSSETTCYYPLIGFNQRGKVAGVAYLERWEIRLNPILLVENSDQFIDEVIAHEYAHLLVFALFGKVQPHGKEWQMMMTEIMGLPANRTHTFNTDNSVTRKYQHFTYRCQCKEHALTSIRHNRIQAGKAQYHCKSCGSSLAYQKA